MKKLQAAATNESRRTVLARSGKAVAAAALAAMTLLPFANAETLFVEAESFATPGGWRVQSNGDTRRASALRIILTNVESYDRRIQSAINIQGRKMQRRAEFLLTRALRRTGWK